MAKMFYTLKEAQSKLDRTEEEINQFAREGRLREFRDGPRVMFKADQVDQLTIEINPPSDDGYNAAYKAGVEKSMDRRTAFEAGIAELHSSAQTEPPLHDPYESERSSPYWDVVEKGINDLVKNTDLGITTNPYYVVGYLVRQLEKTYKK